MIEFGETPVNVNLPPSSVAPRAFMTISEVTIRGLATPIVFCAGAWIASSESAVAGAANRAAAVISAWSVFAFKMLLKIIPQLQFERTKGSTNRGLCSQSRYHRRETGRAVTRIH